MDADPDLEDIKSDTHQPDEELEEDHKDIEDDEHDTLSVTIASTLTTLTSTAPTQELSPQALLFRTQDRHTVDKADDSKGDVTMPSRIKVNCTQVNVEPFAHEKIIAVASTSKLLLIGTLVGSIHILTIRGDDINVLQSHQGRINSISLNSDQSLALSTSQDGKVAIIDIFDCKVVASYQLQDENVTSGALSPNYRSDSVFILSTANPDLPISICKKSIYSFFGVNKLSQDKLVDWAKGRVESVQWEDTGRFIAWASTDGIYVVDMTSKNLVSLLPPPPGLTKSAIQVYPCKLLWIMTSPEESVLVIAWGNTVRLLQIKQTEVDISNELGNSVGKEVDTFVKVISSFEIDKDLVIAAVACHKESEFILLAFNSIEGATPFVIITDTTGAVDKIAQLPTHMPVSFEDLHMSPCVYSNFTSICHIVCGSNAYLLEIRDADDEIGYLMSRQKYKEALQQAQIWSSANLLKEYTFEQVAQNYLDALWIMGEREKFGKILTKAGKIQPDLWRLYVDRLIEKKVLHFVVEYIPTKRPHFEKKFYDKVLKYLLQNDLEMFVKIVHKWPAKIFHARDLLKRFEKDLSKLKNVVGNDKITQEAHTALLIACGKLDSAYDEYISIRQQVMQPLKLRSENSSSSLVQ